MTQCIAIPTSFNIYSPPSTTQSSELFRPGTIILFLGCADSEQFEAIRRRAETHNPELISIINRMHADILSRRRAGQACCTANCLFRGTVLYGQTVLLKEAYICNLSDVSVFAFPHVGGRVSAAGFTVETIYHQEHSDVQLLVVNWASATTPAEKKANELLSSVNIAWTEYLKKIPIPEMRPTAELVNQHAADTHEANEAQHEAEGHEAEGHEAEGHEAEGHEAGGGAFIERIASKGLADPEVDLLMGNDRLDLGETQVVLGADIRSLIRVKTSLVRKP
jgi:hypothetical protein